MILSINANNLNYDIVIERNSLSKASEYLSLNRKVLVITDSGVPSVYSETILNQCKDGYIFTFKNGEENKCFETYKSILSFLIDKSFTRTDCIVAVGGGVVGDLSGFVASTYMRGIDFYNIPTTLLSQVDSSIGGKTAIDFEGVKNIIGAFYQPKKVIIDPNTLLTLDKRQLHSGLVESIKMAATYNKELFEYIYNVEDLDKNIDYIITESLKIKKDVVEKDPYEKHLRKVLNFGHTIGHGIESYFKGKYYHGECVGLGMLYLCSINVKEKLEKILSKFDLPIKIEFNTDEVLDYISHDKKASGNKISVVFVENVGSFEFRTLDVLEIKKIIGGVIHE